MKPQNRAALRSISVSLGVLLGPWVAFGLLFYAVLGPNDWNVILATIAYFITLLVLFEYRGGDLWQRIFPGSPRPRRARNR